MFKVPVLTWNDFENNFKMMAQCKNLNWNRQHIEEAKEMSKNWPLIQKQYLKESGKAMHRANQNNHEFLLFCIDYWEKKLNETESTRNP